MKKITKKNILMVSVILSMVSIVLLVFPKDIRDISCGMTYNICFDVYRWIQLFAVIVPILCTGFIFAVLVPESRFKSWVGYSLAYTVFSSIVLTVSIGERCDMFCHVPVILSVILYWVGSIIFSLIYGEGNVLFKKIVLALVAAALVTGTVIFLLNP